ncbi:RsmB/NOP family class I SAM-dependent RNA methyltransferase [Paenibacillus sp. HJGM_3]|uniref:RsmB/NOP family class I SAM-dependent RNA methyltransferase n=1 Tax=Paenibacillus sp. HJGM_3 TaxID=3379816 RepID=UPI00385B74BA
MPLLLPDPFLHKMQAYLQDEYPAFLASYEAERTSGLRRNPLKLTAAQFAAVSPFGCEPVAWAEEGYYLREGDRPGKHPYYHAGLYYIQEPSAMAPVACLDVQPGDRVLDLCAAPGGKTTQIAGKLQGQGVVVANDIHPDRIKAVVKNVELLGVRNAVVCNETPERLADRFTGYFDKILVDAPCSGEGMFRKEPEMVKAWSLGEVAKYASMQADILRSAARMLRPGGRLVYSTCTFSAEENEATIAGFLDAHPQFRVVPIDTRHGIEPGRPGWLPPLAVSAGAAEATRGTARLWPHKLRGEGHYVAVLARDARTGAPAEAAPAAHAARDAAASVPTGGASRAAAVHATARREPAARPGKPLRRAAGGPERAATAAASSSDRAAVVARFWAEQLRLSAPAAESLAFSGDYVYEAPDDVPDLAGLRVMRPGWFLGTIRKDRFEPSQALAMGLTREQSIRVIELRAESPDAIRYLKGETLHLPEGDVLRADASVPAKGYALVCLDGYPLGWAKWQDGLVKNEYPAGWRWT